MQGMRQGTDRGVAQRCSPAGRAVLPVLVVTASLVLAACTPWPRASTVVPDAVRCAPVLQVLARGSSERLGSKEVVAMRSAFRAAMGSVEVESLELGDLDADGRPDPGGYTAVDAFSAPAVDLATNPADTDVAFIGGYNQSRRIGSLELAMLLTARARTCPQQRIMVGGYSMGAHAIGVGLRKLPASVLARVDAVEFFGDPSFMLGPWARTPGTDVVAGHGFLGERPVYVPAAVAPRTESWCGANDGLCTGNLVLSVTQLLPCTSPELAGSPWCSNRHVDYDRWAVGPAMQTAARRVLAALPAAPRR